jgi:hypothetical protein
MMTSVRVIPRYVNHLWYPILVKMDGYHSIVEMQGKSVNEWNDMVNPLIRLKKISELNYERTN